MTPVKFFFIITNFATKIINIIPGIIYVVVTLKITGVLVCIIIMGNGTFITGRGRGNLAISFLAWQNVKYKKKKF